MQSDGGEEHAADPGRYDLIRKSLRYSVFDGGCSAAMIGFGESFFVAFGLFMKASALQVGLLGSLPQALGSLLQFFSARLNRAFGSRKRIVVTAALSQGLMYIPISLVFFAGSYRVWHLVLFACFYWTFGMILGPAWNSWMGDLVQEDQRGSYFGRRSKITGTATFTALVFAGMVLRTFEGSSRWTQYYGFVIIFFLAFACRMVSALFLSRKYEPPYTTPPRAAFGFLEFLRQARHRNHGRFVLYLALMNFSVFLATPFFTPYMLNWLRLDYFTFTVVSAAAIVGKVLSMPVWGRAADRFGSRRVLSLAGFLMPQVPLLWLVSGNTGWLIAIQLYAGLIWGGFEVASFSFIFDTTSPGNRAICVAYYNMINGIALITGALLGALLARTNIFFGAPYLFVFLVSGMLRLGASIWFVPHIKEVRLVEHIGYSRLFLKVITSMPTLGPVYALIPFRKKEGVKRQIVP